MCASFPFGFEIRMWDLVVLIPDHCLSDYFSLCQTSSIFFESGYDKAVKGEGWASAFISCVQVGDRAWFVRLYGEIIPEL